jgi:hypothetical protein
MFLGSLVGQVGTILRRSRAVGSRHTRLLLVVDPVEDRLGSRAHTHSILVRVDMDTPDGKG